MLFFLHGCFLSQLVLSSPFSLPRSWLLQGGEDWVNPPLFAGFGHRGAEGLEVPRGISKSTWAGGRVIWAQRWWSRQEEVGRGDLDKCGTGMSHQWDPNGCSCSNFSIGGRCKRNPVTFRTPGATLWIAMREKELSRQFSVGCHDKGNFTFEKSSPERFSGSLVTWPEGPAQSYRAPLS